MNFVISVRVCLTPKLSKYVIFSAFTNNEIQWVPFDSYSSKFIVHAPSFILDWLSMNSWIKLGSF